MVTTRMIGRLGNSMFQIAAVIAYAKKYGYAWAAPADARESAIHRVFPDLPKTTHTPSRKFPKGEAYDPQFTDYTEIPDLGPDLFLPGFWQSWKYFAHCEDEVKKVFALDIKPIDAVSIHVRRGDYVTYANSFPPVDENYIFEAVDTIHSMTGEVPRLIVFSDGMDWCKNYFKDYKDGYITFSEGRNEFEDLSLMASCSHHIIANSSFSYWGAYLGYNPDKIVVCPHRESWNGPDHGATRWYRENNREVLPDLIPESWIQIKFR